jgi:hypothetical protein
MKKILLILVMLIAGSVYSQSGDHISYLLTSENTDSTLFLIKRPNSDTSNVFQTHEFMTLKLYAADSLLTVATDSVDLDFEFQMSTKQTSGNWTTESTYTLDADSTWEPWIITDVPVSNDAYGRVIVTGSTNNEKLYFVRLNMIYSGYPRKRN